jgi:hypothetical protein
MKIIEKQQHRYTVLKTFRMKDRSAVVGETVELDDASGVDLTSSGKVMPLSIPKVGKYKAVMPFKFELSGKLVEVKAGEIVEVKRADVIKLMFERKILPLDSEVWCPYKEVKRRPTLTDSLRIGNKEIDIVRPAEIPVEKKPFATSWKK